jgi:hypothetical protein
MTIPLANSGTIFSNTATSGDIKGVLAAAWDVLFTICVFDVLG